MHLSDLFTHKEKGFVSCSPLEKHFSTYQWLWKSFPLRFSWLCTQTRPENCFIATLRPLPGDNSLFPVVIFSLNSGRFLLVWVFVCVWFWGFFCVVFFLLLFCLFFFYFQSWQLEAFLLSPWFFTYCGDFCFYDSIIYLPIYSTWLFFEYIIDCGGRVPGFLLLISIWSSPLKKTKIEWLGKWKYWLL